MIKVWKTLLNIYVVIWVILFKYESVVPTIMFNTHREPTYLNSLDYYRGLNKTKWRHWHSVNQNISEHVLPYFSKNNIMCVWCHCDHKSLTSESLLFSSTNNCITKMSLNHNAYSRASCPFLPFAQQKTPHSLYTI